MRWSSGYPYLEYLDYVYPRDYSHIPMMSKRLEERDKSEAGIVPFIWSRRFISGYVGFLGVNAVFAGDFVGLGGQYVHSVTYSNYVTKFEHLKDD